MVFDQETIDRMIQGLTFMDDPLMTAVFKNDKQAVQLVLRIIMDKADLQVKEVRVQETLQNLRGRSLRLDILASDQHDKQYNIEFQNDNRGASRQRARYHSSLLDANLLQAGKSFTELPETYVIFITREDVLGQGLPIYHIDRFIRENGTAFSDGTHIIYVNSTCRDATPLGLLMQDFYETAAEHMHYDELRKPMHQLKSKREEDDTMYSDFERYMKLDRRKAQMAAWRKGHKVGQEEGLQEGLTESQAKAWNDGQTAGLAAGRTEGLAVGRTEGLAVGRTDTARSLLRMGLITREQIAQATQLPIAEVNRLAAAISQ